MQNETSNMKANQIRATARDIVNCFRYTLGARLTNRAIERLVELGLMEYRGFAANLTKRADQTALTERGCDAAAGRLAARNGAIVRA